MFSSPTPAPGSRAIASNALRSAGLIDRDATMRDLTDKPGGRKASSKIRSHRPHLLELKQPRDSRLRTGSSSQAGPSNPLSIRGASRVMGVRVRNLGPTATPRVKPKVKAVEVWKEVVQKRWNPETQFLNLESLIDDELVKKSGLAPPGRGGDARDAAVIFKIASQLQPKVQTLSLANNNLSGVHLQFLSHYLPDLANLSLQNNNIRQIKDLDILSSRRGRLQKLRELVLIGNPVQTLGAKEDNEKYRRDVINRFSTLEVLDQVAIAQIAFDRPVASTSNAAVAAAPSATTFPCQMSPSFVTGVDGGIVSNFLVRFFNALDTQRRSLVDAYDPNATFSFSANTTIANRARVQGFHTSLPNQTKLTWKAWLGSGSRNLSRVATDPERALKSLHIGALEAVKALENLPATKHDISGPPEKFCLDSFPVVIGQGMGLLLTVHGQFTEVGTEGIRSFDRSFILTPAPEGSPAKLAGWDVVILSDQWTIRVYSSHEAWKPGPLLVQALSREEQEAQQRTPAPAPPILDPQGLLVSMPEAQRNLVMQVCQRTALNVRFAIDCLAGNAWDLDRAVANFEQVKATLSRDAFL
ncbi:hypothetical protein H0H81_011742 [Sphagnurus paluster]|uniref:NTF2-like protein n=1 Tax=Sphagnurus paluster TaxID=117069 RepID=A0A9P7KMB5_9AGAR|nr:hypothetical protein H0H81_011742 [Sphagnurus paluster]